MFVRTSLAVLVAAVIIGAGAAFAQAPPAQPAPPAAGAPAAPGAAGTHHHRRGFMSLFSTLNLSTDQKSKIEAISQKYRQQNVTDQQQRRANMQAERNEVMAVLTPDQRTQFQAKIQQMRERRRESQGAPQNAPPAPPSR